MARATSFVLALSLIAASAGCRGEEPEAIVEGQAAVSAESQDLLTAYDIRVQVYRSFKPDVPAAELPLVFTATELDKVVLVEDEPYFHAFVGVHNEREIWVSPRLNHYYGRDDHDVVRGPVMLEARFLGPSYTRERLQIFAESAEAL